MPTTPIALNQAPKEILRDLLNRDNNTSFTLSQIDFTTMTPTSGSFIRNTAITVTSLPDAPYSGSEVVYYNRLNLGVQWGNTLCVAHVDNPSNSWELLDSINALYDLAITPDDVVFSTIQGQTHQLTADAQSLVWTGSVTVHILPEVVDPEISITDEFMDADDPGFVYSSSEDYAHPTSVLMYAMLTNMNQSPVAYNAGHFTISSVTLGGSPELGQVTLTSTPGSGLTGTMPLTYTRLPFTDFFSSNSIDMTLFLDMDYEIGQAVSAADIRSVLNIMSGLSLSASDVTITSAILTEGSGFTVQGTPTNYLLYGVANFQFAMESVNKSGLVSELTLFNEYDEEDYTPASWAAYQQAYEAGVIVNDNVAATQEEVDDAQTDLVTARQALVGQADKSILQSTYATHCVICETPDTCSAELTAACAAANTLIEDANASQQDVDSANQAILDNLDEMSFHLDTFSSGDLEDQAQPGLVWVDDYVPVLPDVSAITQPTAPMSSAQLVQWYENAISLVVDNMSEDQVVGLTTSNTYAAEYKHSPLIYVIDVEDTETLLYDVTIQQAVDHATEFGGVIIIAWRHLVVTESPGEPEKEVGEKIEGMARTYFDGESSFVSRVWMPAAWFEARQRIDINDLSFIYVDEISNLTGSIEDEPGDFQWTTTAPVLPGPVAIDAPASPILSFSEINDYIDYLESNVQDNMSVGTEIGTTDGTILERSEYIDSLVYVHAQQSGVTNTYDTLEEALVNASNGDGLMIYVRSVEMTEVVGTSKSVGEILPGWTTDNVGFGFPTLTFMISHDDGSGEPPVD